MFSSSSKKSLNPNAKEFKPTTQPKLLHPHNIYSDSTPQPQTTLVQPLPVTVTQPVTYVHYYPICHVSPFHQTQPQPLYHSPEKVFPAVEECFYHTTNTFSNGKKSNVRKRQKYPFTSFNVPVPPRMMRRVFRTFPVVEKPKKVWRPKGKAVESTVSPAYCGKTTVMIRNIPNLLRRDFMLNCLDDCSRNYSLEYDFMYLPMDFRTGDNLGYAFVNFTSPAAANTFISVFDGFKWEGVNTDKGQITSRKICRIRWARVQGLESLLGRFGGSNFPCDDLDYLPVHLDPPRNGLDPNPCPPVVVGKLQLIKRM